MTNHDTTEENTMSTITATATPTDAKGKATLTVHGAANAYSETGKRAAKATHIVLHTNLTDSRTENWAPDFAAPGFQWASLHATRAAAEQTAASDAAPAKDGTRYYDTQVIAVTRDAA